MESAKAEPQSATHTTSLKRHVVISIAIVGASVLLIGTLLYALLYVDVGKVPPVTVDKPAKDFNVAFVQGQQILTNVHGDHFTLGDLKGHPVVLNFWASWCVSCREEARELQKFWLDNKDKVLVIGIAIQDQKEDAKKFADYFGKTYAIGLDEDGKAAIDYGVTGVPETFLIDKDGTIRHKEIGPVDERMLQRLIPKIM